MTQNTISNICCDILLLGQIGPSCVTLPWIQKLALKRQNLHKMILNFHEWQKKIKN